MTNAVAGNEIVTWDRTADGQLTLSTIYATNGLGTGADLGSQGAIAVFWPSASENGSGA